MVEYTQYQQNNNMKNILHLNYGVDLFPEPLQNPIIKKNTATEALAKLKKLLKNNGYTFLAGKIKCTFLLKLIFKCTTI